MGGGTDGGVFGQRHRPSFLCIPGLGRGGGNGGKEEERPHAMSQEARVRLDQYL